MPQLHAKHLNSVVVCIVLGILPFEGGTSVVVYHCASLSAFMFVIDILCCFE